MTFSELGLNSNILKAIKDQGYTKATPIQEKAIPVVLKRQDILAAAQTGTGKTAAFTLPLLEIISKRTHYKDEKAYIKALILTPTRELAAQVEQNISAYSKYLPLKTAVIFGGVGINPQKALFRKGVDIVIATPGRLLDHISQETVDLSRVDFLVLDEADRMLDMGFIHDIKKVMARIPSHRQTLLFSATFSNDIKKLSKGLLKNPKFVEVSSENSTTAQVKQIIYNMEKDKKRELLSHLIREGKWTQILVFTRTKHGANKLCEYLNREGITSSAIHSNKSQGARTKALSGFKAKEIRVLVATDIAARGIDIQLLPHVVNFELPNIPEDYVHRIGRTGRAGNFGEAMSIVCGEEVEYLEDIEKLIKKNIEVVSIDGFTLPRLKKVKMVKKANNRGRNQNSRSNDRPKNNNKKNLKKNDSRSENFKKDDRNSTRPKAKKNNFKNQVDDFIKSRRESKARTNKRVINDAKSKASSSQKDR